MFVSIIPCIRPVTGTFVDNVTFELEQLLDTADDSDVYGQRYVCWPRSGGFEVEDVAIEVVGKMKIASRKKYSEPMRASKVYATDDGRVRYCASTLSNGGLIVLQIVGEKSLESNDTRLAHSWNHVLVAKLKDVEGLVRELSVILGGVTLRKAHISTTLAA